MSEAIYLSVNSTLQLFMKMPDNHHFEKRAALKASYYNCQRRATTVITVAISMLADMI